MSYVELECPWCGERYTFGVVGSTFIGSGHSCGAVKPCFKCDEQGIFAVEYDGVRRSFRCQEHIGGGTILAVQPVAQLSEGTGRTFEQLAHQQRK